MVDSKEASKARSVLESEGETVYEIGLVVSAREGGVPVAIV